MPPTIRLRQRQQGGLRKEMLLWLLIAAYHGLAYRCRTSTTGCTENGTQEHTDSQGKCGPYDGVDVVDVHGEVIQLMSFIAQFLFWSR